MKVAGGWLRRLARITLKPIIPNDAQDRALQIAFGRSGSLLIEDRRPMPLLVAFFYTLDYPCPSY